MAGTGLSSDEDEPIQPKVVPDNKATSDESSEKVLKAKESTGLSSDEEEEEAPKQAAVSKAKESTGLSSDEEEEEAPKQAAASKAKESTGLSSDEEEEEAPKKAAASKAKESTGLSSDEEEEEAPKQAAVSKAKDDDGLGLSSDEEEEEAPKQAAASKAKESDGLGLSSEDEEERRFSDDDRQQDDYMPAPRVERESKHYTYYVPTLPRPKPSTKLHIAKFPPQLGVESQEFKLDKTFAEMEELASSELASESALKELEAAKLFAEQDEDFQSRMLWRYVRRPDGEIDTNEKGQPKRESNARLVKWSDGSMQLLVGEDIFEVNNLKANNGFIYANQVNLSEEGEKTQTMLECHGRVESRLRLRMATAEGRTNAKVSKKVIAGSSRTSKVRVYAMAEDPEQMKAERAKRARANRKAPSRTNTHRPRAAMQEDFLEYDEENVNAIKSRSYADDESDESFMSDDEEEEEVKAPSRARQVTSMQNGRLQGEDDEDDEDEDDEAVNYGRNKKRKGAVDDDDDDE